MFAVRGPAIFVISIHQARQGLPYYFIREIGARKVEHRDGRAHEQEDRNAHHGDGGLLLTSAIAHRAPFLEDKYSWHDTGFFWRLDPLPVPFVAQHLRDSLLDDHGYMGRLKASIERRAS